MKNQNRHHSDNCGTGESECKKTSAQKFVFLLVWVLPAGLWNMTIFMQFLPITQLNDFIKDNMDNLHFLMVPAMIWIIVLFFYGKRKGYITFDSGETES